MGVQRIKLEAPANLDTDFGPTPTGYVDIFVDSTTGIPSYRREDQVVRSLKGDQGIQGNPGTNGTNGTNGVNASGVIVDRVSATESSTGATTTDVTVLTTTLGANVVAPGSALIFDLRGLTENGAVATTFNWWIKIAGTKVVTAASGATAVTAATNKPFSFNGQVSFASIGAAGVAHASAFLNSMAPATATTASFSTAVAGVAVNTTASLLIEVGFNSATSNAANIMRATLGQMELV